MRVPDDLVERVARVVEEVAAETIEPRFGALADDDVDRKHAGEVVTRADREAEAALEARLPSIFAAPVVGEEACSADAAVLDRLHDPYAWVVDPIDGTGNFVAGHADWAVMVALVAQGRTVASWIWQPVHRRMYTAEQGAGAACNGRSLRVGARPVDESQLRGTVLRGFLDEATRARVDANAGRFGLVSTGRMCAGVEYPELVEGEQDFVVFWRTRPWDHAPGTLLVEEAGGVARRPDGSAYVPADGRSGLVVASDTATWARARSILD